MDCAIVILLFGNLHNRWPAGYHSRDAGRAHAANRKGQPVGLPSGVGDASRLREQDNSG